MEDFTMAGSNNKTVKSRLQRLSAGLIMGTTALFANGCGTTIVDPDTTPKKTLAALIGEATEECADWEYPSRGKGGREDLKRRTDVGYMITMPRTTYLLKVLDHYAETNKEGFYNTELGAMTNITLARLLAEQSNLPYPGIIPDHFNKAIAKYQSALRVLPADEHTAMYQREMQQCYELKYIWEAQPRNNSREKMFVLFNYREAQLQARLAEYKQQPYNIMVDTVNCLLFHNTKKRLQYVKDNYASWHDSFDVWVNGNKVGFTDGPNCYTRLLTKSFMKYGAKNDEWKGQLLIERADLQAAFARKYVTYLQVDAHSKNAYTSLMNLTGKDLKEAAGLGGTKTQELAEAKIKTWEKQYSVDTSQ